MSATVVLVPVIITAWPTLAASITAAAAAAGFQVMRKAGPRAARQESVEITMENMDLVAESLTHDDKITVTRDGVTVTFSRNSRGQFTTCVEGNVSKQELNRIGQELAGKVIQQYVYRRLSQELQNQNFATLSEEMGTDQCIRMKVRRYEESA